MTDETITAIDRLGALADEYLHRAIRAERQVAEMRAAIARMPRQEPYITAGEYPAMRGVEDGEDGWGWVQVIDVLAALDAEAERDEANELLHHVKQPPTDDEALDLWRLVKRNHADEADAVVMFTRLLTAAIACRQMCRDSQPARLLGDAQG